MAKTNKPKEAKFPKNKILETKELMDDQDILMALLIDGDEYTVEEAKAVAAEYRHREVK